VAGVPLLALPVSRKLEAKREQVDAGPLARAVWEEPVP
jgi:hypothetical protein